MPLASLARFGAFVALAREAAMAAWALSSMGSRSASCRGSCTPFSRQSEAVFCAAIAASSALGMLSECWMIFLDSRSKTSLANPWKLGRSYALRR